MTSCPLDSPPLTSARPVRSSGVSVSLSVAGVAGFPPVWPSFRPATPRWADFLKARTSRFLHWFSGANEVGVGECLQKETELGSMTVEFEDADPHKGADLSDPNLVRKYFHEAD